jgi:hypothetical protein
LPREQPSVVSQHCTRAIGELAQGLDRRDPVVTTELVIEELLHGFSGPKAGRRITRHLSHPPALTRELRDQIDAASLRDGCRPQSDISRRSRVEAG